MSAPAAVGAASRGLIDATQCRRHMTHLPPTTNPSAALGWITDAHITAMYREYNRATSAPLSAERKAALRAECDHLVARALGIGAEPARKPRRPTLAGVAKQASKAAIEVARYEVKPDGTIVIVIGKGDPAELENPWLAEL